MRTRTRTRTRTHAHAHARAHARSTLLTSITLLLGPSVVLGCPSCYRVLLLLQDSSLVAGYYSILWSWSVASSFFNHMRVSVCALVSSFSLHLLLLLWFDLKLLSSHSSLVLCGAGLRPGPSDVCLCLCTCLKLLFTSVASRVV